MSKHDERKPGASPELHAGPPTGVSLFAGLTLLGFGIGLAAGQPGIGALVGLGAWLTTMGLLGARRGR